MRVLRLALALMLTVLLWAPAVAGPLGLAGRSAPGFGVIVLVQAPLDVQKDCQTVRTCDFRRSSGVRGCLSSFTCRQCRFVAAPCRMQEGRRVCREMRCGWGG